MTGLMFSKILNRQAKDRFGFFFGKVFQRRLLSSFETGNSNIINLDLLSYYGHRIKIQRRSMTTNGKIIKTLQNRNVSFAYRRTALVAINRWTYQVKPSCELVRVTFNRGCPTLSPEDVTPVVLDQSQQCFQLRIRTEKSANILPNLTSNLVFSRPVFLYFFKVMRYNLKYLFTCLIQLHAR